MRTVLPPVCEMPMLDASQTRALEQQASAALPAHTLMARAGEAVARLALALAPHASRIWIAAGPGNNGGDGLAAAVHLRQWGKQVEVSLLGDPAALPVDAADAFARARAAGVAIVDAPHASAPPQLAIDALLGVGANRAPGGPIAQGIRALNQLSCPVLAVDLPSGLQARNGQPLGDHCVTASATLALLTLKPGLFTGAGRDHAGTVWLETLGVDAGGIAPDAWLSAVPLPTSRRHAQHKGSFGDVAVIGGAAGMAGAALLAARAAQAAGSGRVFVELLDRSSGAPLVDVNHPELMFRADWSASGAHVLARSTVVCGCGGGDAVRASLPRLLSSAQRLVLDADALNALATDPMLAALLVARSSRRLATVLTPHPLEAARLLNTTTADVQSDRLRAAQEIARRFACVVVLKGSGTVIAAPNETPRINGTGNPALATAGTGDVLAGWLGGRWTQHAKGDDAAIAFEVACRAVAEHGAAAEPAPPGALRASDLIERLGAR